MFGRRSTEPETEGRYHVELVEGTAPIGIPGAFEPKKGGMYYEDAQRDLQQRVQGALDRGHSRG